MTANTQHDAHQRPPEPIKVVYKKYQKMAAASLEADEDILDFAREKTTEHESKLKRVRSIQGDILNDACEAFASGEVKPLDLSGSTADVPILEHNQLPGKSSNR